jgi:uncharacterized protein DUF2188
MGKNLHVVPRDGEWAVRRDGNERATSVHSTQQEAREEAKRIAKRERTEVVIHGADGRIRDRDSYGRDPLPPKTPRKVLFPKSHRDGEQESSTRVKQ